ncbi:hypothetical protein CHLNCDRAFT_143098, partial [Chlorella variabilis]
MHRIPKFYRWLSERYPLVNQPGGATVVPIIDNLYLDMVSEAAGGSMGAAKGSSSSSSARRAHAACRCLRQGGAPNGIIHNCTHGNNPDVRLTEEEMILKIFTYLDKLFHIVKPQAGGGKLLFMAIDGSAPRAKMNQQRARRFKSAREAQEAMEAAVRRGEPVPEPDARFDSNCITPGTREGTLPRCGTLCMLGDAALRCAALRCAALPCWKRRPDYAPNMRHCLYGLDADLIML